MYDFSQTESPELEYRILFRATDDDPIIVAGLKDDNDSYAVEVGIDGKFRAYGALKNQKKWDRKDRTHIQGNFRVKKGDYNVMNIKFMINGITSPAKQKFDTDDLKHMARNFYYHNTIFEKSEVLEHHLRYTGIWKGLAKDARDDRYKLLSVGNLFRMTLGGRAVIRGRYEEIFSNFDG
ncbi:hypothetical protein MTO96_017411 [Rhipicephalus appendiculatus]